jgi:cytoskeletal protein RodZ
MDRFVSCGLEPDADCAPANVPGRKNKESPEMTGHFLNCTRIVVIVQILLSGKLVCFTVQPVCRTGQKSKQLHTVQEVAEQSEKMELEEAVEILHFRESFGMQEIP